MSNINNRRPLVWLLLGTGYHESDLTMVNFKDLNNIKLQIGLSCANFRPKTKQNKPNIFVLPLSEISENSGQSVGK